ncbi:O-antigen ligase family protein [Clostridium isatidis]|uniref:O-antigen ligase-related domain-containing protein n=1 Tax=Clostridium isatidis TaxID=182773 RepID=A0A343JDE2_9CLOT|nr:O-antigen ligase family protein [Clostridium isatidis]ASW43550.1 hypothetical protein BEN51_08660 [Clostridium isatidis]
MKTLQKIFKIRILEDSVYFKITFLLWALIHSLALGQYVTSYASPIIILWGGLILIKLLLIDRVDFSRKYFILIFSFLLAYLVTIVINRELNLLGNIKTLIWQSIMIIGLFINDYRKDKKQILMDIDRIGRAVIIATLIISAISVLQFFLDISYIVTRVDGRSIPQGYYAARLWGIYVDPNQSCNVAIISLALSVILLLRKTLLNKVLLISNILIQYSLIVLSGSRGGSLGLIILLIGLFYLVFDRKFKDKNNAINSKKLISLILSIILSVALVATFRITRKTLALIPEIGYSISESIINKQNDKDENKSNNITIDRADVESSNGRIELWTDGLKLSKKFPIFGVGDRNIMAIAQKLMPGSSITKQYVHNGYLHMLLSGGAVSLLIMMFLLGDIAISALRNIVNNKKHDNDYYVYTILTSMIGAILLTTFFITEVFFQNSFTAAILWIFVGYIVYLNKKEKFI